MDMKRTIKKMGIGVFFFVVGVGILGFGESARAEIYFYFDAEDGIIGNELPHHQSGGGSNFCQPECSGLGARATYQSIGNVPQGNQYFQWETVDNQTNHYCEIKNVGVFPVTEILSKTFYLAFYMRFDRKDENDIWHEGGGTQSWDKGIEMRGRGVRWTVGWGQWDECNGSYSPGFAANQDHHFTIGSGNPTYRLPGSEYNPSLNGYSCQNPPQLTYERWYAIILGVNMACDTTGSRTLWLNGVKIAESTGIQTTNDCFPNIDHITMGGTLAQPAYDAPSHCRKFDALILADNWQDIIDGGYLRNPEIFLLGDLNNDGVVNIQDVQLCVNVILEVETNPEIVQKAREVAEPVGICNELDVQGIINIILTQ